VKLIVCTLLTCFIIGCSTSNPTIESIESQISKKGSRAYLDELAANHNLLTENIDILQTGLNKGDPDAFSVAGQLRTVSDAGMSTTLNFMVARSIPYQPKMAMGTVDNGFELAGICNVPFVEASKKTVDEFISSAMVALDSEVSNGSELAAECKAIFEGRIANLLK